MKNSAGTRGAPQEAHRRCGYCWVKRAPATAARQGGGAAKAPFGGVTCSGHGVEFAVDGLKEYTFAQVVFS